MQSPPIVPVTVLPAKLQTDGVSLVKITGKPDVAEAVHVLVPLTGIGVGVQVSETV